MENNSVNLRKINKKSKLSQLGASLRTFIIKIFMIKEMVNRDKNGKFKTGSSGLSPVKRIHWRRVAPLIIIIAIAGGLSVYKSNAATQTQCLFCVDKTTEDEQFFAVNAARRSVGAKSLSRRSCMDEVARKWSRTMSANNELSHNTVNNAALIKSKCGYSWVSAGENVGYGGTSVDIFKAFMASPGHKANILNTKWDVVGIGSWRNSKGRLYITQLFMKFQ